MTILTRPPRTKAADPGTDAVATGLRWLADLIEWGQVSVHTSIPVQYNPGGPEQVRAEAERLGLDVEDRGEFCRAVMTLGPGVSYVLYAPEPSREPAEVAR